MGAKFKVGQFVEYCCDGLRYMSAHVGHNGSIGLITGIIEFDAPPDWKGLADHYRYNVKWMVRMDTKSEDQLKSEDELGAGYAQCLLRAIPTEKGDRK